MPTCYGLVGLCCGLVVDLVQGEVGNLLRTCYRETGVMDFDLIQFNVTIATTLLIMVMTMIKMTPLIIHLTFTAQHR